MAFTRFHDDPYRIKKQLEESSFAGRYMLDAPGPGVGTAFFEDPQLRLQKWGANLRTNTINLESDLRGLTRKSNRDIISLNNYKDYAVTAQENMYRTEKPFIDETRATHPAWMYKDLEQNRWETPYLNPLNGLEKRFNENIQTRILEKDYFVPKIPMVNNVNENDYYLTGKSICVGGVIESNLSCPGTLYQNRIQ
jgi:hypothetical protein